MNVAIKVENLSKKYIIRHEKKSASYETLSESLIQGGKKIVTKIRHPINSSKIAEPTQEDFWALKDINFEINQGDKVGIIGRNGAGKSTLLKVLSRIVEPTTGKIHINGRIASLLEVGTGFHPELTGRENIFLNGAVLGMRKAEIKNKFDEIVAFAEVEKFLDTPVKRYSSGMYVRLAFAVAAHLEPETLIVDEVLAVGDLQFQKKCLGKMSDIGNEGISVIFVSHNLSAINQLCDRAILLKQGEIIMQGETTDVVNHYTTTADRNTTPISYYNGADEDLIASLRKISASNINENPSSNLDMNKPICIEIDFEINKPSQGLIIGMTIFSEENNLPIISASDPELDPSRLEKRLPGYYKYRIEIPANILNTGGYRIRSGIVRDRSIIDVKEDVSFKIYDSIGIMTILGYERKNSILAIQLPWEII